MSLHCFETCKRYALYNVVQTYFKKTAALVQSYTQHVLRPHIDSLSDRVRYFIKIPFINKGVYFFDLQSVLRNKNVMNCISKYFENLEPPITFYKYNKPAR